MAVDPETIWKGWDIISQTLGWISFVSWSLSFYPQSIQNYLSKSCAGFSVEFAMLNPFGFYFYTLYTLQGVVDNKVGNTGVIDTNDIFFAVHAFFLSSVQLTQVFIYSTGKDQKGSINWIVVGFLAVQFIIIFSVFGIELSSANKPVEDQINQNWATIRMAGYCKAAITFVKYLPQVYLNWKRQSTVGWSLENVLLDFTGGFFSMVQIIIDAQARGVPVIGGNDTGFNIVKFILSLMSIVFDLIFMFQHYVLYRDKWAKKDKDMERLDKLAQVTESFREMGQDTGGRGFGSVDNQEKVNYTDAPNTGGQNSQDQQY